MDCEQLLIGDEQSSTSLGAHGQREAEELLRAGARETPPENANAESCQAEEVAEIELNAGKKAIISIEDFERCSKLKWLYHPFGYARCKNPKTALHVFLMNPSEGLFVDHKNRDRLDCRRSNLRLCSKAENARNASKRKDARTSQFKGVSAHAPVVAWIAQIQFDGKKIGIGRFESELEAARAYDAKASELFGEFASLNFPNSVSAPYRVVATIKRCPLRPCVVCGGEFKSTRSDRIYCSMSCRNKLAYIQRQMNGHSKKDSDIYSGPEV